MKVLVTTVKEEEDQQRKAIVTVKDTGDGIDPDILPKLSSKFATKSYHGTGIDIGRYLKVMFKTGNIGIGIWNPMKKL